MLALGPKFLYPCSDVLKDRTNKSLEESGLEYTKAQMYKVVCSDLSDLKDVKYDILVFFSPTGIKSLFENFPDFVQGETRLAVFGPTTVKSVKDFNLRVDIEVPNKNAPSMSMALDDYITKANDYFNQSLALSPILGPLHSSLWISPSTHAWFVHS